MAPNNNKTYAPPAEWLKMQNAGAFCGILALIGLLVGSALKLVGGSAQLFYQSWLYGWIFFMAITLGCLIWVLLINMTRATWGFPVLRLFEAGANLMPYMFLLFIPIMANVFQGHDSLYPWADHTAAMADAKMSNRYVYMNPNFWLVRTVVYFFFFSFVAFLMSKMSKDQDATHDASIIKKRMFYASVAFLILSFVGTFAYVDWVMSLDAHWYSTIYAFWFMAGAAITSLTLIAIIAGTLHIKGQAPYAESVTPKVSRDWGNLMLTLCMVWAYFSLSQFLITWSGNLPEEITYYIRRNNGTTSIVTTILVISMFFLPFLCLLTDKTKMNIRILRLVAIWIFSVRFLEAFWNIVPFYPRNLHTELLSQVNPAYLLALVAVGGLWTYGFFNIARNNALVSVEDLAEEEVAHAA